MYSIEWKLDNRSWAVYAERHTYEAVMEFWAPLQELGYPVRVVKILETLPARP